MPRGDGTGPLGRGSMTGRRAGYCAGHDGKGYVDGAPGFGRGRGFRGHSAGGRGLCSRVYAEVLQSELEALRRRIDEINEASARR